MKTKSLLMASAAGFAVMPMANAADLPAKAQPVTPIPVASWEGWYVGLHAGAASQIGHSNFTATSTDGMSYATSQTAFIGGGQLGYNWQRGYFVYGLEGDFSGLTTPTRTNQDCCNRTYGNNISWLSTFRGRMGLAVADTMVYFTGGLAVGGVKNTLTTGTGFFGDYSSSKTRVGWTAGGGIEHMWNRNWTIGLEALFVDLGSYNQSNLKDSNTSASKNTQYANSAWIGRFKVNYKF